MLTADQTIQLAEMFRLLGEPNRLGIVASCLDQPLSVGEITVRLSLSPTFATRGEASLKRSDFRGRGAARSAPQNGR